MGGRFLLLLIVILLAAGSGAYLYEKESLEKIFSFSPESISTPGPLRQLLQVRGGTLTTAGIFTQTNIQRAQDKKTILSRNSLLDAAAEQKLKDMAQQQYFEHVSPQGKGPADLAKDVKYEYLAIGENLALGNFTDDSALVQAWMNSPGHRANILSEKYTEIGVATQEVTFEGRKTWLAVQEFGRPAKDCPTPSTTLRHSFDTKKAQLDTLNTKLTTEVQNLKDMSSEVTELLDKAKAAANEANAKIAEGNSQIQKGNEVYQETGSREQAEVYWNRGEELQAEGKKLQADATNYTAQAEELHTQLSTLQDSYNQQVKQAEALDVELKKLSDTLNLEIRTYNACIK